MTRRRDWEVDPLALKAACDLLDVAQPVNVQVTSRYRSTGGHRSVCGTHIIRLSTYMDAAEASRTLWHELAHASQEERFPSRAQFRVAYDEESAVRGYSANVFEIEARTAGDFAEDHSLVQRIGAVRLKSDPRRWYEEPV